MRIYPGKTSDMESSRRKAPDIDWMTQNSTLRKTERTNGRGFKQKFRTGTPVSVAQSDALPTGDQEVVRSIHAGSSKKFSMSFPS